MFPDRFFGKKKGNVKRSTRTRRALGAFLRIETLEDRALLSISPASGLGPFVHNHPGEELAEIASSVAGVTPANSAVQLSPTATSTSAATHFVVALPSGATTGTSVQVKIIAEDANNQVVTSFSDSVDLTSSDTGATLPASITFNEGRATAQVTFATTGEQTVTATDSADSSITGSGTTNVATPDVATHFVLVMPSGVKPGVPVTVHVVAEDASNDFVSTYSGTADLTSTDTGATLPASVTFDNGHATFHVTLATSGLQSVTATDSANASPSGTATTNVATPAAATHYALFVRSGVAIGSPVTVELAAEDAQNNVVSSYDGTANLAASDSGATLPASVTFTAGHASFQVTFATAGQQTLKAKDSANSTITGSVTTNVAIPHFVFLLPAGTIVGVPVTVQLKASDAQNGLLSSYSGTADLTSSDTAATLPSSVTFENGRASFQVTFNTVGEQTVTATDSVNASPIGTATTDVAAQDVVTHFAVYLTPGATAGTATMARTVPEDAQNHFVSTYSGTVDLTSSDSNATLPASVTFQAGHAAFFQVTFTATGLQTVTATDSVDSTITGTATTNVAAPAVATHFVVYMRPGATLGEPTTVLIVAEDAQNHFVLDYTGTADLTSSDTGATLPASVTFEHGYARVQVTFATLGPQTVTATDSANASLTGTATTNVADQSSQRGWGFFGQFGASWSGAATTNVADRGAEGGWGFVGRFGRNHFGG